MEISNKDFRKLIYESEPLKEVGIVVLEPLNSYIRFDYVNNVFSHFETDFRPTNKQLEILKDYLNEYIENN